jgi:hypothetical protein
LHSTKPFFDRLTKSYIQVEDSMAQISAAVAILNQAIGLPIQRQVRIQQVFIDRQEELLEIARTDHGRKMLLGMGAIDAGWLKQNFPNEDQPLESAGSLPQKTQ